MGPIKIFSGGVLAGAYRGRNLSARTLLHHAVADQPFTAGRLQRGHGQAFCDKSIDMVDSGGWDATNNITCPRCQEIVRRLMATGVV